MALIGSIVAHELKKNIVLVRKDGDNAHSDYVTEGLLKQRCVFIDDLVATAATFQHVIHQLKKVKGSIVGVVLYYDYDECYMGETHIDQWDNQALKNISYPLWKSFNIGAIV